MNKIIPNSWEEKKFGEIGKLQGGFAFKSSKFKKKGIPIIRISNLNNGKVDLENLVYSDHVDKLNNFLIKKNDILIAMSGATTGKIGIYQSNRSAYLNQRVGRFLIQKNELLNLGFLAKIVQQDFFLKKLLVDAIGGAQPNISSNQIEDLSIKIPPLAEQKKIASILNSVDDLIEKTQSQINKLQDLKKATMNELLTKGIGHADFKDSELGRIPKSWKVYELGKLCNFTQGVQISLDETLRTKKDGYIRYLYINDFSLDKNLRFIKDEFPKKIVAEQDLVMANTGHSAGTIFRGKHGVLSNNAFKISIKRLIKSEYLFYYLSTDNYWFKIRKLFNTAGQPHVGHSNIAKLQFLCPPLDEQDKILSILHKIDENILNNEKKLLKIKFLKKSLMQDLLTGKVRAKVN